MSKRIREANNSRTIKFVFLLWLAYVAGVFAVLGVFVYVIIHFISKFW